MWSELKRIIKPNGAIVLFETVLDFTAWSFTTAVACENTNRKWICIEKDEWYYKIGTERVSSI
jgi:DNA modification methylase